MTSLSALTSSSSSSSTSSNSSSSSAPTPLHPISATQHRLRHIADANLPWRGGAFPEARPLTRSTSGGGMRYSTPSPTGLRNTPSPTGSSGTPTSPYTPNTPSNRAPRRRGTPDPRSLNQMPVFTDSTNPALPLIPVDVGLLQAAQQTAQTYVHLSVEEIEELIHMCHEQSAGVPIPMATVAALVNVYVSKVPHFHHESSDHVELLHEEQYWLTFDHKASLPFDPPIDAVTYFNDRAEHRLTRLQQCLTRLAKPQAPLTAPPPSSSSSSSSAPSQATLALSPPVAQSASKPEIIYSSPLADASGIFRTISLMSRTLQSMRASVACDTTTGLFPRFNDHGRFHTRLVDLPEARVTISTPGRSMAVLGYASYTDFTVRISLFERSLVTQSLRELSQSLANGSHVALPAQFNALPLLFNQAVGLPSPPSTSRSSSSAAAAAAAAPAPTAPRHSLFSLLYPHSSQTRLLRAVTELLSLDQRSRYELLSALANQERSSYRIFPKELVALIFDYQRPGMELIKYPRASAVTKK